MLNLYDALQKIREKQYKLSNRSIHSLGTYIEAYDDCCRSLGLPWTEQKQEFNEFLKWLSYEKYKKATTKNTRWTHLILFFSDNERDALNNFFILYDEFLALEKNHKT